MHSLNEFHFPLFLRSSQLESSWVRSQTIKRRSRKGLIVVSFLSLSLFLSFCLKVKRGKRRVEPPHLPYWSLCSDVSDQPEDPWFLVGVPISQNLHLPFFISQTDEIKIPNPFPGFSIVICCLPKYPFSRHSSIRLCLFLLPFQTAGKKSSAALCKTPFFCNSTQTKDFDPFWLLARFDFGDAIFSRW